MAAGNECVMAVPALQRLLQRLFAATGMNTPDSEYSAAAVVQTNLWGIDSHGVLRVPIYITRLRNGAVNPNPDITPVRRGGAFELLNGDAGLGFVVGRTAMQRAIALAQEFNISAVGVHNSNHFGAAGLYAQMAANEGLVGIVMTNVGPNLVAPGGSRPITGNNPLAVSIPRFSGFPLTLDISLSSVAGGKLLLASKKGEKIPLDWATDKEGRPTDDPDKAFAGFLLPVGGHKGLGLSYVVDILSGIMTGGASQFGIKSMYKLPQDPSETGHFMIVINPLLLLSREEWQARMDAFCDTIKHSPMWDGQQEMLLPGELEHRTALARREQGIPLPTHLYDELVELARQLNVPMEPAVRA